MLRTIESMLRTIEPYVWWLLVISPFVILAIPRLRTIVFSFGLAPSEWMSVSRSRLVNIFLIGVLLIPSAFDIVFCREDFPFSYYAMYAKPQRGNRLEVVLAFGVTRDGMQEIQLDIPDYIYPYQQGRLRRVLDRLSNEQFRDDQRDEFLKRMLVVYETRRVDGEHDGPELQELRVYRVTWNLQPNAENRNHPTQRDLLYSYIL